MSMVNHENTLLDSADQQPKIFKQLFIEYWLLGDSMYSSYG